MSYKDILQFLFVFINEILIFRFVILASSSKAKLNLPNVLILLAASFLTSLNNVYSINEFRLIGNYLIGILMFIFVDKESAKQNCFYYSTIMLFGIFIEIILSIILSLFFGSLLKVDFAVQPILITTSYLLWFGGWYLLISNNRIRYVLSKIESSFSKVFKVELLIIILFFLIDIFLVKYYFNFKDHLYIFSVLLSLNLLFLLIFKIFKNRLELRTLEVSNKCLKSDIDLYEKIIKDYNIMKHNLITDLMIIRSVSSVKCQKIIDIKIMSYKKGYAWLGDVSKLPKGLRGLVCLKMVEARISGVEIISECTNLNFDDVSERLSPKEYLDFCEKVDILINNAVEAARDCQTKIVEIKIEGNKKDLICIEITNPFVNEINIAKIGDEKYSTKERNSGYGLHYFMKNRNKKMKTSFEIVNDIYISRIVVILKNRF